MNDGSGSLNCIQGRAVWIAAALAKSSRATGPPCHGAGRKSAVVVAISPAVALTLQNMASARISDRGMNDDVGPVRFPEGEGLSWYCPQKGDPV